MYQVLDMSDMNSRQNLRLLDARTVSAHKHGWYVFNVTKAALAWHYGTSNNLGKNISIFISTLGNTQILISNIGNTQILTSNIGNTLILTNNLGNTLILTKNLGNTQIVTSNLGNTQILTSR